MEMSKLMITFVKIWIGMAVELQQTIDRVNAKARIILERYEIMKRQRREDVERMAMLEKELEKTKAENQQLRSNVEYLKMASIIAPGREDVERTRALLAKLVREIDRCIIDLND